jgi:hypothetical protein
MDECFVNLGVYFEHFVYAHRGRALLHPTRKTAGLVSLVYSNGELRVRAVLIDTQRRQCLAVEPETVTASQSS